MPSMLVAGSALQRSADRADPLAVIFGGIADHRGDEVDARDRLGAVRGSVVENDATAVRPSHEHRALGAGGVEHGGDVVRPAVRLPVRFRAGRLLRPAVPAQVECDETKSLRERAFELPAPGEMALREPM